MTLWRDSPLMPGDRRENITHERQAFRDTKSVSQFFCVFLQREKQVLCKTGEL